MTSRQNQKQTICERMAGFLKALGLDSKPEYIEKIPETLCEDDFSLHDTFHHGFPSHPNCLAYDPVQKILAIGTKHGTVALLGKPGLEGSFKHPETCSVGQMEFIVNKGLLITSCDNRTLYQWSVTGKEPEIKHQLEFTKECPTTISWTYGSQWLYVGNDASNVHLVQVDSFVLSGYTINWNNVVDGHHKLRPGDVMAVKEHPMDQGKILIAYASSLLVLWNIKNKSCDKRYSHDPGINYVLTSVSWLGNGKLFSSSYSDGTLAIWNPKVDNRPDKVFQLHDSEAGGRVSKIIYKLQVQMTEGDPWFICSGGYPEESHSCPKTITVRHGKSLRLLSTNSTIIDFLSIPSSPYVMEPQKPVALVLLTKDGLQVHDLQTEGYPLFSLPHALDVHMPPVSCLEYHANCPEELIASLHSVKSKMLHNFTSTKQWPFMGGKWGQESPYLPTDLILTGHTDGSVRLWYCSSVIFQPFFTLPTTPYFKYNYNPLSATPLPGSPSPTKKTNKASSLPATPLHTVQSPNDPKIPPPRPPPPHIIQHSVSAVETRVEEVGPETSEGERNVPHVKSEPRILRNRISTESDQGEEESALEFERLKTPSPATGQLRVEGEEGPDGHLIRADGATSPGNSRKMVFSREKKSIFKRHSRNKLTDSPKLSPKHVHDSTPEDCSESPAPEDKKKQHVKHVKKSFRKVAMKVKIGKKWASKSSSSDEKEDTDVASLGPSEAGEEEEEVEEVEKDAVDGRTEMTAGEEQGTNGEVPKVTENEVHVTKSDLQDTAPQRPESLGTSSMSQRIGGIKFRKPGKSVRQAEKRSSATPTESTPSKKSMLFERRISAPGNFKVFAGTPVSSGKILNSDSPQNDGQLTPIVEISPPSATNDSVFSTEEEVFAVRGIKCCMWGQWMCVSNVGGHVMAFSFQMNEDITTPKSVDVDFDQDTVLKCGGAASGVQSPSLGWALNERVSEKIPGFRLRQHVRCFSSLQSSGNGGGNGEGEGGEYESIPMSVCTVQYSVDIGLLAVGTNKGLAVIDTESNTVLHILSSITSLLYMTNPSKFTRQVTRESTQPFFQMNRLIIHRHSTSWTLPHTVSHPNVKSPAKKVAAKTPTAKEGQILGGADSSPTDEDDEYSVMDCESSVTALEIVQLPLEKHGPPTLTLWVGTASGHTVTYGIRQKENGTEGGKKRTIQLMPTGLISEHKHPIVLIQFLNEWGDRQVVPYCVSPESSVRVDEGRRRSHVVDGATEVSVSNSKKEHYVIVVDERKIKSYLFPGMTVINKAVSPVENTTLLSSQYFLCQGCHRATRHVYAALMRANQPETAVYRLADLPCLLTLTSSHHMIIHSLPGLRPLILHHYTPLNNHRVMSTFRVSGDGQALYMSSESEIQRLCLQKEDRLNLPHCLPNFHVAIPDPQPASKGKMDWLFGSYPVEMDRASIFGSNSGQPLRSVAKRDGVTGAGSQHHTRSTRRSKVSEGGEGERDRGRGRERLLENRKQEGRDTRREASGLSGQLNKNREALERRKQALTELEQKTAQLADGADDFATMAEKLANKTKSR